MINTTRLALMPVTAGIVHAYQRDCAEMGSLLGVTVPAEWPVSQRSGPTCSTSCRRIRP